MNKIRMWIVWLILLMLTCVPNGYSTVTSLMPMPKLQFTDSVGKPLSGGKLYTCKPGVTCDSTTTSNLKDTYTDSTGATANANPVVLDSAGRANIWVKGYYKIALYTSRGVLVYTQDNVAADNSESTVEKDVLNVYGGGTAYNSTTINAALADVGLTPTTLLLVPGTWTMNANITVPANVTIKCPIGVNIITTGYTFTSSGPIEAGAYQLFTGSGTVALNAYPKNLLWTGGTNNHNTYNSTVSNDLTVTGNANVTGNVGVTGNLTVTGVPSTPPVGSITMWATETAPTGWKECKGDSLVRADYPALFAVLGTLYGAADGSHFNLPDLRGRIPRAWDHAKGNDPDRAGRTAPTATGATITAGDHVGTEQDHQYESHNHTASSSSSSSGSWTRYPTDVGGSGVVISNMGGASGAASEPVSVSTSTSTTVNANGGNETRPVNTNLMFIMKVY